MTLKINVNTIKLKSFSYLILISSFIWYIYWISYDIIVWNKQFFQVNILNYVGVSITLLFIYLGFHSPQIDYLGEFEEESIHIKSTLEKQNFIEEIDPKIVLGECYDPIIKINSNNSFQQKKINLDTENQIEDIKHELQILKNELNIICSDSKN